MLVKRALSQGCDVGYSKKGNLVTNITASTFRISQNVPFPSRINSIKLLFPLAINPSKFSSKALSEFTSYHSQSTTFAKRSHWELPKSLGYIDVSDGRWRCEQTANKTVVKSKQVSGTRSLI